MSFGGIISGMFGGASKAEEQNAKEANQFASQMRQDTEIIFGENQQAQNLLNKAWDGALAQGPYQYGFTTAEDQLLQDQIREAGATATTNTLNAAELRAQQSAGQPGETGGNAALNALTSQVEAQETGKAIAQERLAGYERGSQIATEATDVKQNELAQDNAASYGNAATNAQGAAVQANQAVDTANANSLTAKLIGGAAQGALSLGTAGLGQTLGIMKPGSAGMNLGGAPTAGGATSGGINIPITYGGTANG